ncbi:MAG: hypothetical protein M0017_08860 [Desulfobacteraceae bacterium]|nr:hypothetical protein [Desulfobacteraceae bacterium]
MVKTVLGLMDTCQEAEEAVRELLARGFKPEEIGVAGAAEEPGETAGERPPGVEPLQIEKSAAGATIGGVAGMVAGVITAAIPGVGLVMAAGPVGTALAGAGLGFTAGGIIGALTGTGASEEEAHAYAEGLRRGGVLVTVSAGEERTESAAAILKRHGAVDIERLAASWRAAGWTRFDELASPVSAERATTAEEFRRHCEKTYPGEAFESFWSAYAFGAEMAASPRFRGRSWPEVEGEVRQEWECSVAAPWEEYEEAIRYGWERRTRVPEKA